MRFARNFPPAIASDHNAARSPASHLSMRDLTSVKISRQRRRWPVAGLARTHFASMRSFDQLERSAGASHTAERHSLNTLAQRSLAPSVPLRQRNYARRVIFYLFIYFLIIIRIMHNAGYNNSTQLTKELYPRIQVSTIHITTHNTT